jgi:hypothetical protein
VSRAEERVGWRGADRPNAKTKQSILCTVGLLISRRHLRPLSYFLPGHDSDFCHCEGRIRYCLPLATPVPRQALNVCMCRGPRPQCPPQLRATTAVTRPWRISRQRWVSTLSSKSSSLSNPVGIGHSPPMECRAQCRQSIAGRGWSKSHVYKTTSNTDIQQHLNTEVQIPTNPTTYLRSSRVITTWRRI